MENILGALHYPFIVNALLAIFLISIVSGIVGTLVVVRRMVFVTGGITHASFGGIGIAYYLGLPPVGGAMLFAVATALSVEWLGRRGRMRVDSAIAVLWSLGMSVGVLFMFITPGYTPNLLGFMFGDILTVSDLDIAMLAVVAALLLPCVIAFYRPLMYVSFDQDFARVSGWNVNLINACVSVAASIAIVMAIKVVGIILLLSLFTLPQAIAGVFCKRLSSMMTVSAVVGFAAGLGGLSAAYAFNLPTGAVIAIGLAIIYLLVRILNALRMKMNQN